MGYEQFLPIGQVDFSRTVVAAIREQCMDKSPCNNTVNTFSKHKMSSGLHVGI